MNLVQLLTLCVFLKNIWKIHTKFPCLTHALDAMQSGGVAPAVFNASNEIAVAAFVDKKIAYQQIPQIIQHSLETIPNRDPQCLDDVLQADAEARRVASEWMM